MKKFVKVKNTEGWQETLICSLKVNGEKGYSSTSQYEEELKVEKLD